VAELTEEAFVDAEADIDEDAMIGEYLASQLGDYECDLDAQQAGPREWPKGRGSKLLDQTLCVFNDVIEAPLKYGESADNTVEQNSNVFSLIQMRWLPSARYAGKFCTHKILFF